MSHTHAFKHYIYLFQVLLHSVEIQKQNDQISHTGRLTQNKLQLQAKALLLGILLKKKCYSSIILLLSNPERALSSRKAASNPKTFLDL